MKNKLVKILSVVSLFCLIFSLFVFSSSAEEDIDSTPSYYTANASPGVSSWYYLADNVILVSGTINLEFVSNGVKFSQIICSNGNIIYVNDEISLTIYSNGTFLDSGSWRYIFAYCPNNYQGIYFLRNYCNSAGFSGNTWSSQLEYTFTKFRTFVNDIYLVDLCDELASSSKLFDCNVRLDFNGYIEPRAFNRVLLTGTLYSSDPRSLIFQNVQGGSVVDRFVLNLFEETMNATWSNLVMYAMPANDSGFDFINMLSLISEQALGNFYYGFGEVSLDEEWSYYDYCVLNYDMLSSVTSTRFYSWYGLPQDALGFELDSNLGITPYGVVRTDNFPNSSSTPPYDVVSILPYDDNPIAVSSTFYWLCDYLVWFQNDYTDRARFTGDSLTFIATSPPEDVDMLYNSFGLYAGYCGFVVNGVLYKYFDYSRYDSTLRFYIDVNEDTGDPEIPDLVVSLADLSLYSFVIPSGEYIGCGFYQFCVSNFTVVGGDSLTDIQSAYIEGKNVGFAEGKAYAESKYGEYEQIGYNRGYADAKAVYDTYSGGVIGRLLSAPGDAFDNLILYEEGDISISIWDVFTTLICVTLFIWFLKMFAGG